MKGYNNICMALDKDIDKRNTDIIEKVTGNSIMSSMVGDKCSKMARQYKID